MQSTTQAVELFLAISAVTVKKSTSLKQVQIHMIHVTLNPAYKVETLVIPKDGWVARFVRIGGTLV